MVEITPLEIMIETIFQDGTIKREGGDVFLNIGDLMEGNPEAYEELLRKPFEFVSACKLRMKEFGIGNFLRLINFQTTSNISNISVEDLGSFVKIRGLVGKATKKLALVKKKYFECPACGVIISTGPKKEPKSCSCGHKGKNFREVKLDLQDMREIEIEELQEDTSSSQAQKIRVRLVDELTTSKHDAILNLGSKVCVTGIIQKIKLASKIEQEEIYYYRIFALDIESAEESFDDQISEEDEARILEIGAYKPIEKLSKSLAPNIWGNDDLKKLILLQMVGGVQKTMQDGKTTRDKMHVLVIGDSGTSKTQLGKNTNIRCPKSYYASGDNATAAGITAAVERDEITGSWGVVAGPVCKADDSLVILDELDKFKKEHQMSLLTPMESGMVKINKASIDTTLRANSSILALANPKDGIFDMESPTVEQINLPIPLLNRFDMVYVLKDKIEKHNDDMIAEIIYTNNLESTGEIIPVDLFRKYISYAKRLKPKLKIELLEDLKKFYHDTRKKSIMPSSQMRGMPIGPRHLQGVIRMAEASAKLRLSDSVEEGDLKLAKDLFYDSLIKIGLDDTGTIDLVRVGPGKTLSRKTKTDVVLTIAKKLCEEEGHAKYNILKNGSLEKGITSIEFDRLLEEMNREGLLLRRFSEGSYIYLIQ